MTGQETKEKPVFFRGILILRMTFVHKLGDFYKSIVSWYMEGYAQGSTISNSRYVPTWLFWSIHSKKDLPLLSLYHQNIYFTLSSLGLAVLSQEKIHTENALVSKLMIHG